MRRIGIFSGLAIIVSLVVIVVSRNSHSSNDSIVVLCAASLAGPMEVLKKAFVSAQTGSDSFEIEIMYRGSAELLALHQLSGLGDVLIAADVDYHKTLVEARICDEPLTLGQQLPCLIFTRLSQKDAVSVLRNRDLQNQTGATISIPNPAHAAIGRAVAEIVGFEAYDRLIQRAKIARETVTQVATDVSSGVVDLGFAWTTTTRQFRNLKSVVPVGWENHRSKIGASVFRGSAHRNEANRFRDFLGSPVGQQVFDDFGFSSHSQGALSATQHAESQPK